MENSYLLISDLDGTLLGDDQALRDFARWYEGHRDRLRLVYSSGRLKESIRESIRSTDLPEPDAVIGGVGTQIEFSETKEMGLWPIPCVGWHPDRIHTVLADEQQLQLQPSRFQSKFKISYYAHGISSELLTGIRSRLAASSCQVDLVYSSNRDLDVLPRGVNKGSAAECIAAHWSLPRARVVVSGDTGNDLAMFDRGFRGIVVGNAQRELKKLDSSSVFHATKSYAAGVLQGLEHWLDYGRSGTTPTTSRALRR